MTISNNIKKIYQVDAFTNEPFKGNPAGVVITNEMLEPDFMQKLANEMNLSETAFINKVDGYFNIRYFTPNAEVPLCGHASLAAAHILFEYNIVNISESIHFKTKKYDIAVSQKDDVLSIEFPIFSLKEIEIPGEFEELTGLSPQELYKSEHGWYLAYFEDHTDIIRAHPLYSHMKHSDFGHLIITSAGDKSHNCDFIYRCFAPALGINEDPVTGSAQCALAPFWRIKTGKTSFLSYQASKRSGLLSSQIITENSIKVEGKAITIFEGQLKI